MKYKTTKEVKKIREAVANYMRSEGCGCCSDGKAHDIHEAILGELLNVPMYDDKSGYNFQQFEQS